MDNNQDGIALFDTLFTNNHISLLKLMLPLLSSSGQKSLALYIKYLELQYTIQYFTRHPQGIIFSTPNTENTYDLNHVLTSALPYCNPQEKDTLMQLRNMLGSLQNLQDMMEMLNTMKELFPEGFEPSENGGMFGGLSPEMFEQISSMFGNPGS